MVKWWSSKSSSGVRFPPPLFMKNNSVLKLLIFSLFICLSPYYVFLNQLYIAPSSFLYILIIFFTFYWVFSIFIFLYKRGQYSIYVSSLQRFWKRTLYLFWVIELYLFGIFLFLIFISPNETYYLLDHQSQFTNHDEVLINWFVPLQYFVIVFFLFHILIVLPTHSLFSNVLLILLTVISLLLVTDEFSQCFYLLMNLNNEFLTPLLDIPVFDDSIYLNKEKLKEKLENWKGEKNEAYEILLQQIEEKERVYSYRQDMWENDDDYARYRTINFFHIVISILKVYHIVFILLMFFTSVNFMNNFWKKSLNLLSSNLQNFYFLFFFYFLSILIPFKHYLQYNYMSMYFFFFFDINTWGFLISNIYDLFMTI